MAVAVPAILYAFEKWSSIQSIRSAETGR